MDLIKNILALLLFAVLVIYGFNTVAGMASGTREDQIAIGDP